MIIQLSNLLNDRDFSMSRAVDKKSPDGVDRKVIYIEATGKNGESVMAEVFADELIRAATVLKEDW